MLLVKAVRLPLSHGKNADYTDFQVVNIVIDSNKVLRLVSVRAWCVADVRGASCKVPEQT